VIEPICERIRDQLADYIYGELPLAEVEAVECHLSACSDCREELAATRRALAAVDRAGLGSAPDGVAEAVIVGVAARLVRPRLRLRLLTSFAAGLALTAAGAWLFLGAPEGESARANETLAVEAAAVAADAEGVLRLVDDLERENDALLRLLSQGGDKEPSRS